MDGVVMTKQQRMDYAKEHDSKLVAAVEGLSKSVTDVGRELMAMRNESIEPWKFVKNPKTDYSDGFENWRDYARFRLGTMSTAAMYEYISAYSLTQGEKPVSESEVQKLGVKKAAQLARLPESRRSKKRVARAIGSRLADVKAEVEEILDKDAPNDQKRARTVPYYIALPEEVILLIENIEKDGQYLESVRDGDKTWTLRAKLWHKVWWYFLDGNKELLEAAAEYRKAHENKATEFDPAKIEALVEQAVQPSV